MTLQTEQERAYETYLAQQLTVIEKVSGVFTGLDDRLDYLNKTMARIEGLLGGMAPIVQPLAPATVVERAPTEGVLLDGRLDNMVTALENLGLFTHGILDWGVVHRGEANTITVTNKGWEANQLRHREFLIIDGKGEGQLRTITANTENKLSLRPDFDVKPDGTSRYVIRMATSEMLGDPIVRLGRYEDNETDFDTLVSWTITDNKLGDLHEVSVLSDDDSKTRFALSIAGTNQELPDDVIDTPLTLPWRLNTLAPGAVVLLQVKSSDGTSLNVTGSITGTER